MNIQVYVFVFSTFLGPRNTCEWIQLGWRFRSGVVFCRTQVALSEANEGHGLVAPELRVPRQMRL